QRTSSYFGRPWVWCALHDYGGNQGFEGYLKNVTVAPIEALNSPNSSMSGFGLTMEGQEGNEIIYDIFLDQAWSSSPLNISSYVSSWVGCRYHISKLPVTVQRAWSILSNTVYNNTDPNTQATV
ncbi:tim-barrel domain-containing protein, partial [Hysterangium stoloniferum]